MPSGSLGQLPGVDFFPEAEHELVEMHSPDASPTVHGLFGLDGGGGVPDVGGGGGVPNAGGGGGIDGFCSMSQPKQAGSVKGKAADCPARSVSEAQWYWQGYQPLTCRTGWHHRVYLHQEKY